MATLVLAWGWHGLTPTILFIKSKSTKSTLSNPHGGVQPPHLARQKTPPPLGLYGRYVPQALWRETFFKHRMPDGLMLENKQRWPAERVGVRLQGYLAHKKTPTHLGPP